MNKTTLIYRLFFLLVTILIIPALPLLIIYIGAESTEYVITGTLNMSVSPSASVWELYLQAIKNLISLNFGTSISSGQPVFDEIIIGITQSSIIIIPSIIISYIFGTILGVLRRNNKFSGKSKLEFVFFIPMIVYSYLFLFLSDSLGIDFTSGIKYLYAIVILSIYPTYIIYKSFITNYQSVKESEFYKFHLSSGFDKSQILKKFLTRFIAIEYLSFFENLVLYMFGFIYFVESPFAISGIGSKFIISVHRFDYPFVIGFCVFSIVLFSVISILTETLKLRIDVRQQ